MERWITIITLNYNYEAEIVKGRLESEGMQVNITNIIINQIYPIDRLHIQVRPQDVGLAVDILREIGYNIRKNEPKSLLQYIDEQTNRIIIIGRLPVVIRVIIIAAIPALITALLIVYLAK